MGVVEVSTEVNSSMSRETQVGIITTSCKNLSSLKKVYVNSLKKRFQTHFKDQKYRWFKSRNGIQQKTGGLEANEKDTCVSKAKINILWKHSIAPQTKKPDSDSLFIHNTGEKG